MFWAFILLAIIYTVHVISLKGRYRGEIASAARRGRNNGGIGILIHQSLLNKDNSHAKFLIEKSSAEQITELRSQLDYIANSMQSGQKMYYIGTLSELYVYLNEKIQKESPDWVLIVKS